VAKISINDVSTDFFDRTIGDIQVLDNGRIAVHGHIHQNAAVRGRGEYSSGQCRLRFKVEQSNVNSSDFSCGIVSKFMPLDSLLYMSNNHYNFRGFIGHNNNNIFYFTSRSYNNQKDDIIEFSSIVSLNCYIMDMNWVVCQLFTTANYQISSFYQIEIDFNSTFYFLQLPSNNQATITMANTVKTTEGRVLISSSLRTCSDVPFQFVSNKNCLSH
jgi:hypothetical protein